MNQLDNQYRERFCVMFSRLDVASPDKVAWYIRWLLRLEPRLPLSLQFEVNNSNPEDLIENIWGWNAPRQRTAKLLWQTVQGNDDPEYFERHFRDDQDLLVRHAENCKAVLE